MKLHSFVKRIPFFVIFLIVSIQIVLINFYQNNYTKTLPTSILSQTPSLSRTTARNFTLSLTPPTKSNIKLALTSLSSQSVLVKNLNDNSTLYEKNASNKMYIASITKLMTAATALSNISPDLVVRTDSSSVSIVDSYVKLPDNTDYSLIDLLYALLLPSSNQAAYTFANNLGYNNFINKMNSIAKALELEDSYFINPAGFDDQINTNGKKITNQSSARDVAVLTKYILQNKQILEIIKTKNKVISSTNGQNIKLTNTNELLDLIPGVIGVKTGTENLAGQCLDLAYVKDGNTYIIIILNSTDRYADARQIIQSINAL